MKKPVFLVATNALIVIVVSILLLQSLAMVQRRAQVASAKGQISIQKQGQTEFITLEKGQSINIGDTVVTKEDGNATFAFADMTRWKAAPNSQITIKKASVDALKKSEISQLRLDSGQIFVRMVKPLSTGSRFEIQTPNALVKVVGTVLSVKISNGRTEVDVLKGHADVVTEGKSVSIKAGQGGIINTGEVEVKKSDCRQLAAQQDLIKPALQVGLRTTSDDKSVYVTGATEIGNRVSVNNKDVESQADGSFMTSFPIQRGLHEFKVVAMDKHGDSTTECRAVEVNPKTKKLKSVKCR
jgi:hypothetical protein